MTAALCILGVATGSSILVIFGLPADSVLDTFIDLSAGILYHAVASRFSK